MASDMATRRLRKELMAIKRTPIDNIVAVPLESNILEWHYVITGMKGSPYDGGHYHGKLKFPPEYPMKPPAVMMLTPNGRFACAKRLCLSMSDFHPESWNPMWSVSTILMGLHSFMLDTAGTLGSVNSTTAQKKKLATESLEFNCKNAAFRKLFPELVELHERRKKSSASEARGSKTTNEDAMVSGKSGGTSTSRICKGEKSGEAVPHGTGVAPQNGDVIGTERARRVNNTSCLFSVFSVGVAIGVLGLAYILRP